MKNLISFSLGVFCLFGCASPLFANDEMEMRIVGGEAASQGEFPYQVFIENVWNTSEILKCGGAIYNSEYVITAAHCMYFRDTNTYANPRRVWITAGTTDLEMTTEEDSLYKQVMRATEIIPHPSFEYKQHENNKGSQPTYDIVLVKVSPPFKFNERVQPIALAPENYVVQGNGTVTGWGRPDPYGKWTKQMRKVDIPLVDWQECARLFKGYAVVNKDMFCTGTKEGGVTPCNGDSGGPIACRYLSDPDRTFLCGVASFGPNRCPNYSVYTRVSSYVSWVNGVVQGQRH